MHFEHLTIIFNGEIYNHREVREKYKLNCQTASDTETILRAYDKLGHKCLDDFDGMFTFAIHDRNTNTLFIARDRAGKKPLYYYTTAGGFVFSSELNTIRNQVEPEINGQSIRQYLHYGALHQSATPYKNVFELPAGHYAVVNISDASVIVRQWWKIDIYYEHRLDERLETAMEKVDSLLHTAVKRRLESSDLEAGCFLSGGIDSGLVTAIASQYNSTIKTFTVSFSGSYDESPLAALVASKYNTHHTEISISFKDLQNDIEKIIANYGEPFYDDSAIPSYYVSREAKKYLTVILNGDGSDELFGGYRRYVPFAKHDFFSKNTLTTWLAAGMKKIIPFSHNKQTRLNYLYRLADLASQKGADVYFSSTTDIFNSFYDQLIYGADDPVQEFREEIKRLNTTKLSGLQKIMMLDFKSILPDILLPKMDIATMASSVEGRSPFLSKELLEYVPQLPDRYKIKGTTTKYLLRKLAVKYLPGELINQPKRGFEVPLKQWVDKELRDIIFSYLDNQNSYADNFVEKKFIRRLLERKIKVSDEKRAKMLYALFALDVWYMKCALNNDRQK
jgi:asparagine synthase (glutamine-hydrolysing)